MKILHSLALAGALALFLAIPAGATTTTQPGVKVASTQANTASGFAANVRDLCVYNAGANEIHYAFGAAAVATAGVNEIAPGATVCWQNLEFTTTTAAGALSAIVGIINAAGETSTVYLYAVTRQ